MGRLTTILLMGTYLLLALSLSTLLWNSGSDSGTCIAAAFGTLGLCFAIHNFASQHLTERRLSREIDLVRDAHRLMVDAIETTQKDMVELADRVQNQRVGRTDELTSEVRMLENLVVKLGESIEDRLSEWRSASAVATPPPLSRRDQQAMLLIETVREALIENRVDLYLQPVISLPQRKTIFYESFSRLRDVTGRVLMPAEYLSVADAEGLVPSIDNLLLFRCVQIVRRLAKQDRRIGIFCNVSLTSLGDEVFFPQFLEFLNENKDLSDSLIFELGQDAFMGRGALEARHMAKLADMGFKFSMDKVTSIDFDLQDMQRSDVRFVKIGTSLLLDQLMNIEGKPALKFLKDIHAGDYAALLSRYGVEIIAEKVENERQVVDVLEVGIGYAQGHLFGEPRAIKEQVMLETDPPAGFIRSTLPPQRRRA
jgi:cyclic-di-GMP phosphodiesterase, flagellum assembly factor TipF